MVQLAVYRELREFQAHQVYLAFQVSLGLLVVPAVQEDSTPHIARLDLLVELSCYFVRFLEERFSNYSLE